MTKTCRMLLGAAAVAVLTLSCGGDDAVAPTSDEATTTTTVPDSAGASASSGNEDQPDDTGPPVEAESLGLPPEVAECVEQAGSDAAVGEVVTGCVRAGPLARGFVEGLAEQFPGRYSPEQLACLAESYGALSSEDVGYLVASGLNPLEDYPEAEQVAEDLFGGCGVEPPV